jgi:hypothetical protein
MLGRIPFQGFRRQLSRMFEQVEFVLEIDIHPGLAGEGHPSYAIALGKHPDPSVP